MKNQSNSDFTPSSSTSSSSSSNIDPILLTALNDSKSRELLLTVESSCENLFNDLQRDDESVRLDDLKE